MTKKEPAKKPATKQPATTKAKKPAKTPQATPDLQSAESAPGTLLTVSDVAREAGVDPKAARTALRRSGRQATDGRYAKVVRGSDEHTALLLFFEGNQDGVDSSPPKV